MRHLTRPLLAAFLLFAPFLLSAAQAQEAPPGWKTEHPAPTVVVYTPPDLAPGQVYTVGVYSPTTLNGKSLEDWLLARITRSPLPPGVTAGVPVVKSRNESAVVASRQLTSTSGPLADLYIGLHSTGASAQIVQVLWTGDLYDKHKAATLALVSAAARALAQSPPPGGGPDAPPAARPGAGVRPSQIQGVYTEYVVQMGVGGFFTQVFKPLLALKDGTFCEFLDVPPSDFDVTESRRRYPDRWGRWRSNASATSHRWDGSAQHIQTLDSKKGVWETAEWIGPLAGGGPGQHLSGTYSHTGGSGNTAFGGNMAAVQQDSYTFLPDGHFRSGRDVGADLGIGTYSEKSAAGGTYILGNYAITLRFRDGSARRCLYARVKDGMIFMQEDAYVTGNDK